MKKVIIVFKNQNKKSANRFLKNQSVWSAYDAPRINRISFLKEKGVDTNELFLLTPTEREVRANELIKKVFTPNCEVATATVTSLEQIKTKTQQSLFDNLQSFSDVGEQILKGGYNQSLKVLIEVTLIEATPEMMKWDAELPFVFTNEKLENELVVSCGITHAKNSCYSLAVGCKLEDGLLKIGLGSKFYFSGNNAIKEVDFNYYFKYNGNNGKSIIIPSDMDFLKFNFHYYKWADAIKSGDYARKDVVSVVKTDNGNYVVMQDNPRRAVVVLASGAVIEKNDAQFGSARKIQTKQFSLSNYADAIIDYEDVQRKEMEKKEEAFQLKMSEMYEENKGYYIVELPCFQNDFHKGGHKERWTNWKVLANSQMDAYNIAVRMAEKKGYFWFKEAAKCQIDFYGVWTDEKEVILQEEGLV